MHVKHHSFEHSTTAFRWAHSGIPRYSGHWLSSLCCWYPLHAPHMQLLNLEQMKATAMMNSIVYRKPLHKENIFPLVMNPNDPHSVWDAFSLNTKYNGKGALGGHEPCYVGYHLWYSLRGRNAGGASVALQVRMHPRLRSVRTMKDRTLDDVWGVGALKYC